MAEKMRENPLLFNASVASPFDDLSTAALLIPPIEPITSKSKNNAIISATEDVSNVSLPQSLQPHLEMNNSSSPANSSNFNDASLSLSCQALPGSGLPPPPVSLSGAKGGSLLRKPANKYIVPPELNGNSTHHFISPSPHPSMFTPQQTLPPTVATFTPPTVIHSEQGCFTPTNDHGPATQFVQTFSPASPSSSVEILSPQNGAVANPIPSTYIPASFEAMAVKPPTQGELYHPVIPHWFYSEGKPSVWKPFSFKDSFNLENAYREGSSEKVSTDGGRYDVTIKERKRIPVYWDGEGSKVMRSSWFRRCHSGPFPVPYTEEIGEKLEEEYKDAMLTGRWHRQVELPAGDRVMINSPHSMHHYHIQEPTENTNVTAISESQYPQTVRRGTHDCEIKDGAADTVDHLVFLIHGIGSVCDLSFRSVVECVDDFRAMGEDLLSTHFKDAIDEGKVGRVEILPISWHKALHGDATGLDEKLKNITLRSIPKFREFTNDTLLDILLYTSPVYCQHIMDTVASEINRLLALFRERNPSFNGGVSLGGHSLGAIILFDLLIHQNPIQNQSTKEVTAEPRDHLTAADDKPSDLDIHRKSLTSQVQFEIGAAGTGQPAIIYPQLSFHPQAFFLMGSPVGMFITVRGIENLGPSFKLPTCDRVFNIFHPFDPVAYRLETLIDPSFREIRPVLLPHHKGRKRMHLELKDTIERVGSDLKNKVVESIQFTWNKFYQMYTGSQSDSMCVEVNQLEEQMRKANHESEMVYSENDVRVGELNRGFRVDYVLQEKPYEVFTEYIFALQAHLTYWTSEDTLLMILKELYKINGITSKREIERKSSDIKPPMGPSPNAAPTHPTISSPQVVYVNGQVVTSPQPSIAGPDITPPPPIPLFSPPVSLPSVSPPVGMAGTGPRAIRGRPVFDPFKTQKPTVGMDPTASPSQGVLPPPPVVSNLSFNQNKQS